MVEKKTKDEVIGKLLFLNVSLDHHLTRLVKDNLTEILINKTSELLNQLLVDEKISSEIKTTTSLRQGAVPSVE